MKVQFENMPPLSPGETPWADHEVQVRSMLNAAEDTPPEWLEARIWQTLDAEGTLPSEANRAPWIAAAVTGGLLLGAFWMGSEDTPHKSASPAPSAVQVEADRASKLAEEEASELVLPQDGKEAFEPVAIQQTQSPAPQAEEVIEHRELEVLKGLESKAIPAQSNVNRTPIQTTPAQGDTVRLTGTLKLKQ